MKSRFITFIIISLFAFKTIAVDRFALVIGNSGYSEKPLENTLNDANDVSLSFSLLGYDVTTIIDGDREIMERSVTDLSSRLTKDSMLVFYYAGHAAQVDKYNYLIPVNEDISSENDLRYKGVNLEWILGAFKDSASRTNILILDSCRDNPFKNSSRGSGGRGLTVVSAPSTYGNEIKNTAIIYATTDGNIADDGDGRNSPFTTAFLKNLNRENETVLDVMTYVTQDVFTSSKGKQEPTMTNALKEKVYFFDNREPSIAPTVKPVIKSNTGIRIDSEIVGSLYINDVLFSEILKGEVKDILDLEPGSYELSLQTKFYNEILNVTVIDNQVVSVSFKNQFSSDNSDVDEKLIASQLEGFKENKKYLEITIGNLEDELESIYSNYHNHIGAKNIRNEQKKAATKSGSISFLSYVCAGICAYYAYENYREYNDDALVSKLIYGTVGAGTTGVISSFYSKYKNKRVIEYDLQEQIYLSQIKSREDELKRLRNDYDEVVLQIIAYEK